MVADKTGSLIATSALFGAKVAGAELSVQRALAAFGEEIGIVFQLTDDIIDITTDETGKTPGTDLREGIPTLPTLLFRRSADPTSPRTPGCCGCWTPTSATTPTWPRRWSCSEHTGASTRRAPRSTVGRTEPAPS